MNTKNVPFYGGITNLSPTLLSTRIQRDARPRVSAKHSLDTFSDPSPRILMQHKIGRELCNLLRIWDTMGNFQVLAIFSLGDFWSFNPQAQAHQKNRMKFKRKRRHELSLVSTYAWLGYALILFFPFSRIIQNWMQKTLPATKRIRSQAKTLSISEFQNKQFLKIPKFFPNFE